MKRRSVYWLAVLALLAVPVLAACGGGSGGGGGGSSSGAEAVKVEMTEFAFSPESLTAKVNEPLKLNLINEGSVVHDFAVDAIDAHSGEIGAGESKTIELVFKQAGEFDFICSVPGHEASGMHGTITVTD